MSGLARVLLEQGFDVRGSDLSSTPVTERLQNIGAAVYTGHCANNIRDAELVVVSTAIDSANPELQEATKKGVPVIHRADLLGLLMNRQSGLAIAGAHGKTTTTAMLALVMEKCHLDPTILIGGELTNIGGNAKLGRGEYLVAEADESDKS
ncbi:MAG: Mur ligase domain-containing protein, partial [Desulfotomaculaceae bacterium]